MLTATQPQRDAAAAEALPQDGLHLDVTGAVDITRPGAVCAAIERILTRRYRGFAPAALRQLFDDFERLYSGRYPGFFACDTDYHDMQHVLDVTLAAARLIDGYDRTRSGRDRLGCERALIGVAVALFHDSGYIRRKGDSRHWHGAEYTRVHVRRSARFLADYLPTIGLAEAAPLAARLVHFTGYECGPGDIELGDARDQTLGALIGTADVLAQMAHPGYLQKCRDHLFREFELGGIAREVDRHGREHVRYASALDLLRQTPAFMRSALQERLEQLFGGLYRCVADHFGGANPYIAAIERNRSYLEALLAAGDWQRLECGVLRPRRAARPAEAEACC